MFEKRFIAVSPQLFTADGSTDGVITIANATLFKVKQEVRINATSLPQLELEVKAVLSITQLVVGPRGGNINSVIDISQYSVAGGSNIDAALQKRPSIDYSEIWRAVYDEEPTVALRNVLVDKLGNKIATITDDDGNIRLAVDTDGAGGGGLAPKKYDDVKYVRDSSGCVIQYQFFLNNVSVGNIDVFYDMYGVAEYKKA